MTHSARPRRRLFDRPLRPFVRVIGAILALFVIAYAVLWITKGRFLKEPVMRLASRYTGRTVSVGGDFQLYLNPHVKFLAEDIRVSNPAWARDDQLFEARLVETELSTLRLIFGHRRFRYLTIDRGDVALEWNAKRENTWTFRDPTGEPFELPDIRRAAITSTTLSYRDPALELALGVKISDIAARNSTLPVIGFNGRGTSRGAAFGLSGRLTSPNATMAGGRNDLAARVTIADSTIDVSGTLPGATQLEGADLRLNARGSNFVTPFRLLGVAIPETRAYRVTSKLTKAGGEWRFTSIAGRFGDSDLGGRMTISLPNDRMLIDADLASNKLDILDAGPWMGYNPQALAKGGAVRAATKAGEAPRVLPDAPLSIESLERFDAKVKYRAKTVRTGAVPMANLAIDLDLERKLLKLAPVAFDVAGGRLMGDFTINARVAPVITDYDVRLTAVPLGRVLTAFDVENSGTTVTMRGRVKLRGYGDTVRKSLATSSGRIALVFPRGTLWVRNAELVELDIGDFLQAAISKDLRKPIEVRCGLMGFTVDRGLAKADPIFIDTTKNVIRGRGGFSFRDETIDMGIEADAKNFSIFSGQAPIAINGRFAEPGVNPISGKLLARAGIGLGLAALVSPIGLIAAFVDLGEEEDTNCAPVLRGARGAEVKRADEAAEKR